jgi:TolB-like protein/DNA-binding winged helix-turn-helix (wHTH) protein/lipoprotein NlpI
VHSRQAGPQPSIRFGEDFELDLRPRRLRRGSHVLKLERIPLEILVLLLEHREQIVSREEIVARIWGNDVFLDTDNSIRGAIRKVRQVLKDNPETPRFIQTVTGRGYRFIAPVFSSGEGHPAELSRSETAMQSLASGLDSSLKAHRRFLVDEEQERTTVQPPAARPARGLGRRPAWPIVFLGIALLAVLCVLSLAEWRAWRRAPGSSTGSERKTVLAVLPFDNLSRDPDQEFFSEGLTEEMIAQLGKLDPQQLNVISRGSVARYKSSALAASQIGRELGADYLLQGSVRRDSGRVRITVQLIEARDQTDLWTESYDRELKDILALQDSVARTVASQIRIALTAEQQTRLANARSVDPEAYEAYLKGRYYWNKRTADGMQKASTYFQEAIDRDPTYGAAYSGLADCNSGLAWHGFASPAQVLPKAEAAARKAIEIDPQSAEAHASLALVLHHRWDWPGAESEFQRALQLNPQYANAHHWYGDYLSVRGRHDEALLEAKQGLKLDPLNLMIGTWVALRFYFAQKYDLAVDQSRSTVELDPGFAAAHLLLGEAYRQTGRHEALAELETAAKLSGDNPLYWAQVAVAHAAAGQRTEAVRIMTYLQRTSTQRYVSPYGLAQLNAALNNKEQTFRWLQIAYDDRSVWLSYLAVDPVFDRYRSEPRFQDLLRRLRL